MFHHVASRTRSGRSFGADASSRCRQSGLDMFITKPFWEPRLVLPGQGLVIS